MKRNVFYLLALALASGSMENLGSHREDYLPKYKPNYGGSKYRRSVKTSLEGLTLKRNNKLKRSKRRTSKANRIHNLLTQ